MLKYYYKIKEVIEKESNNFMNYFKNNELRIYLSKFHFYEQINMNNLNSFVENKIRSFIKKNKEKINIIKIKDNYYEYNLIKNIKDNINNNLQYRIKLLPEWKLYKIKLLNDIKKNVTDIFINELLSKNKNQIDLNINKYC